LTGKTGLYPMLKPPGMTSHDVVAALRRMTGERHVGHAGTLDPAAGGVLLVLVGQSVTRLAEYLMDLPKTYVAELRFGRTTTTLDWTGDTVEWAPAGAVGALSRPDVERALPGFTGRIEQVPPAVSAVHVGGERSYRLAREGRPPKLEARTVTVYSIDLMDFMPAAATGGREVGLPGEALARVRVRCSRGTYIRALAHDVGRALGVGAHLGFLVREAVGPFHVGDSLTLEEAKVASGGGIHGVPLSPARAVSHLPAVRPDRVAVDRLRRGEALPYSGGVWGNGAEGSASVTAGLRMVRVLSDSGELVAVAELAGGRLRPRKVLCPEVGHGARDRAGHPQGGDTVD